MYKTLFIPLCCIGWFFSVQAQDSLSTSPVPRQRIWLVAGAHAAIWGGSYLALNQAWYADYPRRSFHFFNDNAEWNQVDKAGHIWTTYQVSRLSASLWKWGGLNERQSAIWGGVSGIAYQSIIEIQDGFSTEWGFSWGDMAANVAGAAAFSVQQIAWKDQRIQIKFSYSNYDYEPGLIERRNQLFGKDLSERLLKDYNAQTYWVSANLHSFFKHSGFPRWLNFSAGYAAGGMLGGRENRWTDKEGFMYDRSDIRRTRRFFIAPDLDLTRIRTRSKLLKAVFFSLNAIKFPAPALEISPGNKLKLHALYF